ncbi:helix-turn-helix domain-containing protein [Aureivirga sp. CE67]|uniref:helix-turn-helix domain-containing protein n=1 Tax=Aureivirga sp. CE67 TaxID=1788983 RepID=UPI0018C8E657|nr:helix-turn-helix domain-containing protein [Aureivirga sp. CE67]
MITDFLDITIFGSLVLLSFLLLSNPLKINKKANFWFGFFMLFWASYWIDQVYLIFEKEQLNETLDFVLKIPQFLIPLCFYLGVLNFTNPNYKFTKKSLIFLILPFIYYTLLIYKQITGFPNKSILLGIVLIHGLLYIIVSFFKIRKHQKQILLFSSNTLEINLVWLERIIIISMVLIFSMTVFSILFYGFPLNLWMNLIVLVTIFATAYNILKQKEIFPKDKKQKEEIENIQENPISNNSKKQLLSDEKLIELKSKLNSLMLEKEPYLDSEINLIILSDQLEITSHQLSYVINNGFNQNFSQFINKYRVEKAKILLQGKDSEKLSMLGIAFESGFSSKSSFNTTFKKITGKTPSEFKKERSGL